MLLLLMRHGIAISPEDAHGLPDAQRPLTPEGLRRVRQVARALDKLAVAPDLVLASPLLRAVQTAQAVAVVLGARRHRTTLALAPGSAPRRLLAEVARTRAKSVLCVGHAPHLDLVLAAAVGAPAPVCELKKAGVACLELEPRSLRALLAWLLQPGVARRLR
jgi:phosphohistidine phosphatase